MMLKDYGPLDEKFLSSVEQFWQFKLPQDYRKFLLCYNGGYPCKTIFNFDDSSSVIDCFYGFMKDFIKNILIKYRDIGIRYPINTLPIGDDVFGNLILLSVKGPDRGKIYFWDHEMEVEDGETPDYSNLTLIADSFDEFINSLKSEDEVEA